MPNQMLGTAPDFTSMAINTLNQESKAVMEEQAQQRAREQQAVIEQQQRAAQREETIVRMKQQADAEMEQTYQRLALTAPNYYETDDEGGTVYEDKVINENGVPKPVKVPKVLIPGGRFGQYVGLKAPYKQSSGGPAGNTRFNVDEWAAKNKELYEKDPVAAIDQYANLNSTAKSQVDAKATLPVSGVAPQVAKDLHTTMTAQKNAISMIDQLEANYNELKKSSGLGAKAGGLIRSGMAWANMDNAAQLYEQNRKSSASPLARAVQMEKGTLNEGDIGRSYAMTPSITTGKDVAKQMFAQMRKQVKKAAAAQLVSLPEEIVKNKGDVILAKYNMLLDEGKGKVAEIAKNVSRSYGKLVKINGKWVKE